MTVSSIAPEKVALSGTTLQQRANADERWLKTVGSHKASAPKPPVTPIRKAGSTPFTSTKSLTSSPAHLSTHLLDYHNQSLDDLTRGIEATTWRGAILQGHEDGLPGLNVATAVTAKVCDSIASVANGYFEDTSTEGLRREARLAVKEYKTNLTAAESKLDGRSARSLDAARQYAEASVNRLHGKYDNDMGQFADMGAVTAEMVRKGCISSAAVLGRPIAGFAAGGLVTGITQGALDLSYKANGMERTSEQRLQSLSSDGMLLLSSIALKRVSGAVGTGVEAIAPESGLFAQPLVRRAVTNVAAQSAVQTLTSGGQLLTSAMILAAQGHLFTQEGGSQLAQESKTGLLNVAFAPLNGTLNSLMPAKAGFHAISFQASKDTVTAIMQQEANALMTEGRHINASEAYYSFASMIQSLPGNMGGKLMASAAQKKAQLHIPDDVVFGLDETAQRNTYRTVLSSKTIDVQVLGPTVFQEPARGPKAKGRTLPFSPGVSGFLMQAREGVGPGQTKRGLGVEVSWPGPSGPWVGANELGDTVHTVAAAYAKGGKDYNGKFNVLATSEPQSTSTVNFLQTAFPKSVIIVHTPPQNLISDPGTFDIEGFYRTVKSGPTNAEALGHPFDATRFYGQALADNLALPKDLRALLTGTPSQRDRQRVAVYLLLKHPDILNRSVRKGIIFARETDDGTASRNSTALSMAQIAKLYRDRGIMPVIMGPPVSHSADLFQNDIHLSRHWKTISSLRLQAYMLDRMGKANTLVAFGQMSGALDMIKLSSNIRVTEIGPTFRMGMWQEALGNRHFAVIPPNRNYNALSLDPLDHVYDDETLHQIGLSLDRQLGR